MFSTFTEQEIIKLMHQVDTMMDLTALLAESETARALNLWKMMLQRMPDFVINEYIKDRAEDDYDMKENKHG